jgi:hypothetical protein
VADTAEGGVVRVLPFLAGFARLLIPADQEDRIVGARRDRQRRQDTRRERREAKQAEVADHRDHASRRRHFDEDHEDDKRRRRDGPVDDQQHHHDGHHRDHGDLHHALVTGFGPVGRQRCLAGDVGLDSRRRVRPVNDVANRRDGLVAQRLALVACEVHLNVGGFAVGTLRTGRGDQVTPVVLHVLDVFGVLLQLVDQIVVVTMGLVAERLVALEDDHGHAVGVELLEL